MKTIKYILSCIVGCFDSLVGKGMNGGVKEGLIGMCSILVIVLTFLVSLLIIDNKLNFDYRINVLCSLVATVLFIFIIFAILVIVEKIL